MKLVTRLVLGFAIVLISASEAFPCSCAHWSVREKFRNADAIFLATVVDLRPMNPTQDFPIAANLVKLRIEKRWKGSADSEITAVADFDQPGFCGDLNLAVGEKYLIYANRKKGKLIIQTDCGPNVNFKYAAAEIKRLNTFRFRFIAGIYPYPSI